MEDARKRAWINAYHRLEEIYDHWLESPDNSITIRKELGIPSNIELQPEHCSIYLNILYDQCESNPNSPFNLNSKIHVQRFKQNGKSRYAIMPECSGVFGDIFDFMYEDSQLTNIWFDEDALVTREFLAEHKVTEDEWVERAEIYIERLECADDTLTMDIINSEIIIKIDPNLDNVVSKLIEPKPGLQSNLDITTKSGILDQEIEESEEELAEEVAPEPQSKEVIDENSDLDEFEFNLDDNEDNCEEGDRRSDVEPLGGRGDNLLEKNEESS